jgi:hypothetical protein
MPDNNHHLGRNSGPNVKKMWVCTCVFACIEKSSLVNNNCGNVLHDDVACPNMASATWLHKWIITYNWSHGAIRTHQSRAIKFTEVKLDLTSLRPSHRSVSPLILTLTVFKIQGDTLRWLAALPMIAEEIVSEVLVVFEFFHFMWALLMEVVSMF